MTTFDVSVLVSNPAAGSQQWYRDQRVIEAESVREAIDRATDQVVKDGLDVKVGGAIVSIRQEEK